jgi:16S rRNA G966 N2-methylase RsmD
VRDVLRDTPVADSTTDLLTIARQPVEVQREIAVKVAAGATVDGAMYSARKEALKASKSERDANGVASLPPMSDRYEIIHGDMKDVLATWPEHSVDCILTDPPYPREFVDLYLYLAQLSIRVLKPGGLLVMMCGQSYLPEIFERLSSITKADWGLDYRWTMAYLTPGGQAVQLFQRHVNTFWKPVLVYSNGPVHSDSPWFGDVAKSSSNDNDKTLHKWGQSESGFVSLMSAVTIPGQVVMDPFMGAGTTGVVALGMDRRFIGIDIDADCVATARERIERFINE